jgi:zinc transport system ATP-binding protein
VSTLLECRSLVVGHRGRAVLPEIELRVETGQLWAIIGRNGSGKTTWLRTVLGLLPPVSGTIERAPGIRMSYLPQRSSLDELYPLLARDVVRMGTLRNWSFIGPRLVGEALEVERALAEMKVADLADRPFRQLSEGQKQRVLFARVAASDAQLALLDEPTSAMDLVAEREAFDMLDALRKSRRMAIIVVSHYLGLIREFADRALLVDRDTPAVVAGAPEEVFRHGVFAARYGDSFPPGSNG